LRHHADVQIEAIRTKKEHLSAWISPVSLRPMGQPVRRNYAVAYPVTNTSEFVFTNSRAMFMVFAIMVRLKKRSARVYKIPSDRGARCEVHWATMKPARGHVRREQRGYIGGVLPAKAHFCFALRFFCIVLMSAYQASPRKYMLRFVMRSKSIPQKVLGEESTSNTPHDFGRNIAA
jgi:hypothetical protein